METGTYVVIDNNGYVIDENLTARQAMDIILTDDSHRYDIRQEGDTFWLYTSEFSSAAAGLGNRPLTKSVICSLADTLEGATDEIALRVIKAQWQRKPEAMTTQEYADMLARL